MGLKFFGLQPFNFFNPGDGLLHLRRSNRKHQLFLVFDFRERGWLPPQKPASGTRAIPVSPLPITNRFFVFLTLSGSAGAGGPAGIYLPFFTAS